jgi:hypothetical protein
VSRLGFAGVSVVCGALAASPYLLVLTGSTGSMILVYGFDGGKGLRDACRAPPTR